MAHLLLLPFGSAGDVFPFIWLGRRLLACGHRVTMITACLFEDQARAAGLGFVPIGRAGDFEAMMRDPRLWKAGHGSKLVFEFALAAIEPYLAAIESSGPADLLLAPMTALGARLAREKLGIPLITVHLQPIVFMSAYETPLLHPAMRWLGHLPVWFKRLLFSLPNPVDWFALTEVRRLCRKHGVHPPRSLWREWWNSPDGVLALFPGWFAQPQPDWPPDLFQWDFPLEDLAREQPLTAELEAFLTAGARPVVFTPGSANVQAARFFEVAAAAVRNCACRAVFVTREPAQVPAHLPDGILTVAYAPFGSLLERAAVLVHHGGIGTLAQGLAAGVPQIVMAMAHDQPDNADRLARLGAGIHLSARRFTPDRVTRALQRLLHDPSFAQCAAKYARPPGARRAAEDLMEWIERRLHPAKIKERRTPP